MSVIPVDPVCLRKPRSNAGSYKPTAQKIQRSVNCLKSEVCALGQDVSDNTIAISNLQNAQTSSIAMVLSADLTLPDSTLTLMTGWSALNATNAFSTSDLSGDIFTVPVDGVYHVSANIAWETHGGATLRSTVIRHTDGMTTTSYTGNNGSVAGATSNSAMFTPISASAGDMIYIWGQQDSGGALDATATGSSWTIVQYN